MAEKPNFLAELKAARAHGDKNAVRDAMRRADEWAKANPKTPIADLGGALKAARARKNARDAERVIRDALEQQQGHLLAADDLLWVVSEVGAWESSWRAGQAIAAWLYHHGPIHRGLIEVAEEIADYNNAEWLDGVLLWIEPTPLRWCAHAGWLNVFAGWDLAARLKKDGRAMPETYDDPEIQRIYKECALGGIATHARWVIEERGDAARRTLQAAANTHELERDVRLILEAWKEALT
jgi:hypothetical protein